MALFLSCCLDQWKLDLDGASSQLQLLIGQPKGHPLDRSAMKGANVQVLNAITPEKRRS
jgi:hypothetical protein